MPAQAAGRSRIGGLPRWSGGGVAAGGAVARMKIWQAFQAQYPRIHYRPNPSSIRGVGVAQTHREPMLFHASPW